MRNLLCLVLILLCGARVQAQAEVSLFDGKTTSGWVIKGDAEVKDGVLILGGNQKTWVRTAADFSPNVELHLEYSTENNRPIQFEWHHRQFLGEGMHSVSLDRTSKKPGEWIEAIYWGKEDPAGNGWANSSQWRVVGEPAFAGQSMGGSASLPRSAFVAFDIPVGQKLYLRHVRVKTAPVPSFPWLTVLIAGALVLLLVLALAEWAIRKKRRAPIQSNVQPGRGTS